MKAPDGIRLLVSMLALTGIFTATAFAALPEQPPARPAVAAAVVALDACVKRLDPELDVGLQRIEQRCPGLVPRLERSGVTALLPRDWKRPRSELSAGGLRALRRALGDGSLPGVLSPARSAAPDTLVLQALIAGASNRSEADSRLWARFRHWVHAMVGGLRSDDEGRNPLSRFKRLELPERVWTLLAYTAMLVLLAFAIWIVRAELRAAGLLRRTPAAGALRAANASAAGAANAVFAELPLLERPAWLLQQLGVSLQRLGRLSSPGALTPREMASVAELDDPADRAPLQAIAMAAERVRFGAAPPTLPELEPAVNAAQALLQRLQVPR